MISSIASNRDDSDFNYTDDISGVTGDSSMDESTRDQWAEYLRTAPTVEIENLEIESKWSGEKDLQVLDSIEDPVLSNVSSPPEYQDDGKDTAGGSSDDLEATASADEDRNEGEAAEDREVEEDTLQQVLDMERFWQHCIATALGAQMIAEERDILEPGELFLAGLLHDMGRLALITVDPRKYSLQSTGR